MPRAKNRLVGNLIAAISFGVASPAEACRIYQPRSAELAEIGSVVLATVETSANVEQPGWNTWRLTARTVTIVAGSRTANQYKFSVSLSSTGCGRTPLPQRGERWVIYLDDSAKGTVLHAFPLAFIRDYDRRLSDIN